MSRAPEIPSSEPINPHLFSPEDLQRLLGPELKPAGSHSSTEYGEGFSAQLGDKQEGAEILEISFYNRVYNPNDGNSYKKQYPTLVAESRTIKHSGQFDSFVAVKPRSSVVVDRVVAIYPIEDGIWISGLLGNREAILQIHKDGSTDYHLSKAVKSKAPLQAVEDEVEMLRSERHALEVRQEKALIRRMRAAMGEGASEEQLLEQVTNEAERRRAPKLSDQE